MPSSAKPVIALPQTEAAEPFDAWFDDLADEEIRTAYFHGALTAITIGPKPPDNVMEIANAIYPEGLTGQEGVDQAEFEQIIRALQREILAAARQREIAYPLPTDDRVALAEACSAWAEGFVREIRRNREAWAPLFADPDHRSDLIAIVALGAEEEVRAKIFSEAPEINDLLELEMMLAIPGAVHRIERYWRKQRASSDALLTEPRRNERCSCGSGLKYKKCCGAKRRGKVRIRTDEA